MPIKLSEVKRSRLLRQVKANYERAVNARSDWPARQESRYKRYLADPTTRPPGPWTNSARLFIPTTRDILERQLSSFHLTQFGNPDHIKLDPFGKEDAKNAEMGGRFLRWALRKTVGFLEAKDGKPALSYCGIQDALMDSAGVYKVYPYDVPWRMPAGDTRRWLSTIIQIDLLDQGLLLVAPDAEGLQYPEASFVQQELWMTWDQLTRLKRKAPEGDAYAYTLPSREDQFKGDRTKDVTDRKRAELEREGQTLDVGEGFWTLFIECYERFELDPAFGEEDVIVSWLPDADEPYQLARVVRLSDVFPVLDRPLRPFFPITVWPQSRQWRGQNVPDRLASLQDVINRLHEQLINYGDVSIMPFFFYNAVLTGELPSLRDVEPGEGVPVYDPNGIQFVQRASLNRHFVELLQLFQTHVERTSQVTDFNLGRQPDRPNAPRTYGATIALLQQSQQAFTPLITHQSSQFAQLLGFFYSLWQQRMPYGGVYAPIFPASRDDMAPPPPMPQEPSFLPMNGGDPSLHGSASWLNGAPTPINGQTSMENGPSMPPMMPNGAPMSPMRQQIAETGIPIDELQRLSPKAAKDLHSRLFQGGPQTQIFEARAVEDQDLSGVFDVIFEIDPNEQFKRQVLISLAPLLEPKLQYWPPGLRRLWEEVWESSGLDDFQEIWPKELADLEGAVILQTANQRLQHPQVPGAPGEAPGGAEPPGQAPSAGGMPPPGGQDVPPQPDLSQIGAP